MPIEERAIHQTKEQEITETMMMKTLQKRQSLLRGSRSARAAGRVAPSRLADVIVALLLLSLCFSGSRISTVSATSSSSNPLSSFLDKPANLILMDCDNTLYREQALLEAAAASSSSTTASATTPSGGIESQIIARIHNYCFSRGYGGNNGTVLADQWHAEYGATIEGIRQSLLRRQRQEQQEQQQQQQIMGRDTDDDGTIVNRDNHDSHMIVEAQLREFYQTVYRDVDVSPLMWGIRPRHYGATGYSHHDDQWKQDIGLLRDIWEANNNNNNNAPKFAWASNSPRHHVEKVLHALGLLSTTRTTTTRDDDDATTTTTTQSSLVQLVTPDFHPAGEDRGILGQTALHQDNTDFVPFPTKLHAKAFFGNLLSSSSSKDNNNNDDDSSCCLIDDSATVLQAVAQQTNLQTLPVTESQSLLQAVGIALGWNDAHFVWNDVTYLRAKNQVDLSSFHGPTYVALLQELAAVLEARTRPGPLVVVDMGAGLLSLLSLLLLGARGVNNDDDKANVLPSLGHFLASRPEALAGMDHIVYHAYEPNEKLAPSCVETLLSHGFVQDGDTTTISNEDDESLEMQFYRDEQDGLPYMEVRLHFRDYQSQLLSANNSPSPDVLLGCCFADLMDPNDLVPSIVQTFLAKPREDQHHALAYFPITFGGITQFLPPQPLDSTNTKIIPSDATAFSLYAKALEERHGHCLDSFKLQKAMQNYGGQLLSKGRSDWKIPPSIKVGDDETEDSYMWHAMMHFFGSTAAPAIHTAGFDAHGWLHRARKSRPTIQACNQDFLWKLPFIGRHNPPESSSVTNDVAADESYSEIQFTAPQTVSTVEKSTQNQPLGPNQVRISGVCSLISTGTELKVFRGEFEDAALDVNIPSMESERMKYPLSYGYSLVGRVVECGSEVENPDKLLGKLAFAFAPHAEQVVVDVGAMQLVPDGIDPYDAIFLPAVETALCIVHDAHLRFGESVAVFGQGLIGLLVTAVLKRSGAAASSGLTTVDTIPSRLAASAAMGASQALFPSDVDKAAPFDVCIEVSGNQKALQSAIDHTVDHGRVILASWYGNQSVNLQLGLDFHRSHKTLTVSQVSEIPPHLSGTWSKERRFGLAWDLVKSIRPSQLLTKTAPLSQAQSVYSSLEKGEELAVAFDLQQK